MIRRTLGLCSCLVASLAIAGAASAQTPNDIFRNVAKPVTADAVDYQGMVTIGGIPQWISVRGRHRSNPVLLVLHGGPGFTLSPVSYYFMREWEEYFTVVQWDQRGAGKTFAANNPDAIRPTMNMARMVDDAEEMVGYLRRTYGKDRIVLFGHSFGSILGAQLAQRRPEWLYAYVGMGQVTDAPRSEAMGYAATLKAAETAHNEKAVAELKAIAPFPDPVHPQRNLQNLGQERKWLATYGGYYWRGGVGHNEEIARLSPDYSAEELKMRDVAQSFSDQALWAEVGRTNLMQRTQFRTPVIILQGRHDLGTSSTLVAEWFSHVSAPRKKLVWFEDSAHMVYEEEPGKVLVTLVNDVLPLTLGR